jgi:GNAT superfamily N-acetyltransferase
MNIHYEENLLTASQFLLLREAVGWQGVENQIEKALKAGLYNVLAKDENDVVGMGRLVGDGVMYWYVQDVIIRPEYQGKGIGKTIMEHIIRHIEKSSLPGTTVTVGLMAAKGKDAFYEKLGFVARPSEIYGAGMIKLHPIPDK